MKYPIATQSFHHGALVGRRGQPIKDKLSQQTLKHLSDNQLIRLPKNVSADPKAAAGKKSSASPVAPVSPQTTAKRSGTGGRKKRGAPSS